MTDLAKWRKQLDTIDAEIIRLLAKRFQITTKIGTYKAEHDLPIRDHGREASLLARIEKLAADQDVDPTLAHNLMRLIIDQTAKNHQKIREARSHDV